MANSSVFHCHADQVQREACSHSHPMHPVLPGMTLRPSEDGKATWEGCVKALTELLADQEEMLMAVDMNAVDALDPAWRQRWDGCAARRDHNGQGSQRQAVPVSGQRRCRLFCKRLKPDLAVRGRLHCRCGSVGTWTGTALFHTALAEGPRSLKRQ